MLSLHDIALGYSGETIADNVSLSLEAGQICAVIGHNGAGKSTLLRTIMGLQPPLAGRIAWTGAKPRTIGYLGRSTEIDCQFPVRIKDVVAMGAWNELISGQVLIAPKVGRLMMRLRAPALQR